MEYIYSAMVLYSAGKDITEDAINAILTAAGVEADAAKIKALVASLEGVDIKEAIASAAISAARLLPPQPPQPPPLPQTPLPQPPTSPKRKLSVRRRPLPVSPLCSDERLVLS